MGRVEKRTLFMKPILQVLGGNLYLKDQLRRATIMCRQQSSNCLAMRWLPADAKYHILQACLNEVSSLFGPNFVHFNACDGETSNLFKSTWYCMTVMMPTRDIRSLQKSRKNSVVQRGQAKARGDEVSEKDATCTFTDMTRQPRATLRIVIVNETELRRVVDGKLRPPAYGFFNERHAERFRMITDFGRNFQKQLVRTPANARSMSERSPFTSEKVHAPKEAESKPDGGHMKRVHSVPNMNVAGITHGRPGLLGRRAIGKDATTTEDAFAQSLNHEERWEQTEDENDAVSENNCFLRLHVPHYTGHREVHPYSHSLGNSHSRSDLNAASVDVFQSPALPAKNDPHPGKKFGPRVF